PKLIDVSSRDNPIAAAEAEQAVLPPLPEIDEGKEVASRFVSPAQVAAIKSEFEQFVVLAPEALRPQLRARFLRNLHSGLARAEASKGPPPGAYTVTRIGDEHVFHYHGAHGPIECLRLEAKQ